MNPELLTIGLQVGKYFIATALLVLIYLFLFLGKASFNQSRIFLLTLPFLALLLSQWNITVYTPPTKYVEIIAPVTGNDYSTAESTFQYNQKENNVNVTTKLDAIKTSVISRLSIINMIVLCFAIIAIMLLVPAIWQCIKLLKIRKVGKISKYNDFEVVTNSTIPTPFSFYKTIFINESLKGKKQELILKHESWHIKHRHYIDVFIIEFTTRLFWFNPLLWWVRKELRSVCEFQADKSVLEDGQEIYTYQTLILEEVMGQSSFLANGFNNSFTKKRFITMKNNQKVRLNSLRGILLPFFLLMIFGSLSFSIGKQKTEYIVKEVSQNREEKKNELISNVNNSILVTTGKYPIVSSNKPTTVNDSILKTKSKVEKPKSEIKDSIKVGNKMIAITKEMDEVTDKLIQTLSEGLGLASIMLDKLAESDDKEFYRSRLPSILNSLNMLFSPKKNYDKNDLSDEYMNTITKTTLIKSSINFLTVKAEMNKLKFEKSAKVKLDNYFKLMSQVRNDNLIWPLIRQKKYTIVESNSLAPNTTTEPTKEELIKKRDGKIWNEAFRASDSQVKAFDVPFSNKIIIDRIENDLSANETKVKLLVPVLSDNYWVRFDKGFEINDIESNDKYLIRRLEDGLPLSKTIIITNKRNKMVNITMVFPLINPEIKRIDIVENVTDNSEIMSNGKGHYIFKNIFVPAYLVTKIKTGKVYK